MKKKMFIIFIATLILLTLISVVITKINDWFNTHYFVFNQPVKVDLKTPMEVKVRKPQIIEKKLILSYPDEIDTPIEKYICDKFGALDCKVALAIVKAESGFNDQAINVNTNGSVDLGCWQINFPTHKGTISPADALDCYKATDWALSKFQRDGNFNAWVAYTTNKWLAHYEE